VSKSGSVTLKNQVVDCPAGGPACSVKSTLTASVSASAKKKKKKKLKLGSSAYKQAAGTKAAIKLKLTKKGLRQLVRLKKIRASATIGVTRGGQTTTKKLSVTLKAPKRKR
jgi:hypothetical protein